MIPEPAASDPFETYLDELVVALRGDPRVVRRIVAEADAHLRDALDAGATPAEAIAAFGTPSAVAASHRRRLVVPAGALARRLVLTVGLLCSLGFVAIGVSGAVVVAMDAMWGAEFVAGDLPTITYTPQRCAEYHELAPDQPTCHLAAARHHAEEIETTRLGAGAVGLAGLGSWAWLRRRWRWSAGAAPDSPAVVLAVGAAVFAVAAAGTGSEVLAAAGWRSTAGLGQWLSAAIVSVVAGGVFAVAYVHALRRPHALMGG